MKQTLIATVIVLVIAVAVTVLYAAQPKTQAAQPVLSPVTVTVQGFECGGCVPKLQSFLEKQKGVSGVKATMTPPQVTAQLDEKVLPVSKFVAAIDGQKNMHNKLYIASFVTFVDAPMCKNEPKMCAACPPEIQKMLKDVKGVTGVTLDDTGRIATIGLDPKVAVTTTAIADALKKSKFNFTVSFTATQTSQTAAVDGKQGCGMMNGDMSTCSMKDSADKSACPMKDSADKSACPMKDSADKSACPMKDSADKSACPMNCGK